MFWGNSTLSHSLKKKDLSPKKLSIYHLDSFEYFKPQKVCSLSVANVFFFFQWLNNFWFITIHKPNAGFFCFFAHIIVDSKLYILGLKYNK